MDHSHIGAWNIRGLNDPLKQKEVLSFIRSQKLSLVGIVETKVRSENFDKTVRFCFPTQWASIHNGSNDRVSRIIVAWNALDVTVDIIFSSSQLVVVKVLSADQKLFYVSFVYGHNSVVDRRSLWIDMKTMALSIGNAPWIQLGDFNVVRNPTERLMGFDRGASDEFNACLDSVGMDDMPSKGFWFTWSNKRSGLGDNKSKLDRVLINAGWLDGFPESEAVFLAPGISDHCSCVVTIFPDTPKRSPFKFFHFWMKHGQFKELVASSWAEPVMGNSCKRLSTKLQRLKPVLRKFNTQFFSKIGQRVSQVREELSHVQALCYQTPHDSSLQELEKELHMKFISPSAAEESFKKQKSRVQWLALGDKNTRFFHQKLKTHCLRNKILSLENSHGVRLTDPKEVKEEILGYYVGLLGTPFAQRRDAYQILRLTVEQRLTAAMKEALTCVVSEAEIKSAMWSIKGDKAPGPDGLVRPGFVLLLEACPLLVVGFNRSVSPVLLGCMGLPSGF
ncbi:hypothetical protein Vadar_031371 [Vaccinium darrowii]|uniref:Uncharacterized protein n=1 Tax=Vaccinium darrowii TaxID=229202 RepID=A0ACB7Z8A6_9ERIC|nr:hypothetical protein Vadar_031371 [Vaccinium darrowii]